MIPLLRECVKCGGGMRVQVRVRRVNHSEQPEQIVLVISVRGYLGRAGAILGERGCPGRARAFLGERASRPLIMKTNLSFLRGRDARSPKVPVSTVHCKSSQPTTILSLSPRIRSVRQGGGDIEGAWQLQRVRRSWIWKIGVDVLEGSWQGQGRLCRRSGRFPLKATEGSRLGHMRRRCWVI